MRRIVLVALALVAAFASGALADKSLTYFTVVPTDVQYLQFQRNPQAPNGWTITAKGQVRASAGGGYTATVTANASAGQANTVETFITNNVVPALNTQEGL